MVGVGFSSLYSKKSISASARDLVVGHNQTLDILRERNKLTGMILGVLKIKERL